MESKRIRARYSELRDIVTALRKNPELPQGAKIGREARREYIKRSYGLRNAAFPIYLAGTTGSLASAGSFMSMFDNNYVHEAVTCGLLVLMSVVACGGYAMHSVCKRDNDLRKLAASGKLEREDSNYDIQRDFDLCSLETT